MSRHTTFRFYLDPTVEQCEVLARYAGASRFAFNQCLRIVKTALTDRKADPDIEVPWTGFDLINTFNAWKKTEAAGRVFTVDADGAVEVVVTGLAWLGEVCQQVFEEAAVDLGKGLKSWSDSRFGKRKGKPIGFPRFKKKTGTAPSFRLRNKHPKGKPAAIRVGDHDRPRSVTLPSIGVVSVHDGTRRLRCMLTRQRAKICFATVSHHGGRWWIALNVQAADLHPDLQRWPLGSNGSDGCRSRCRARRRDHITAKMPPPGWRGIIIVSPICGRHFLHQVSNELVKTHDRLVIENLNVSGMLANHRLARAISDAGWSEFARLLTYKQSWSGGQLVYADRWYPSTRLCSHCGVVDTAMTLADRVFTCGCGHTADRDRNAANLARWGHTHHDDLDRSPDPQAGGRATNVRRRDGADRHSRVGETIPKDAETDVHTAPAD